MARGRKCSLTPDEQLENTIDEIENLKEKLDELKKEKRELEEMIHQIKLKELDDMISSNGLSYDEVKEMLLNKNA